MPNAQVGDSSELTKMLEAGVHFGHQARRWYPKMEQFIWQARDGVHIFDLIKTVQCLKKAQEAIKQDVLEGKVVCFVGTKRQASPIVKEEAIRAGVAYITTRWAGGTMTNWPQIKASIDRLNKIRNGLEKGEFNHYTKKERVLLEREATRLERLFSGLTNLKNPPDVLFLVDITREKAAIKEAHTISVKTYAVVDSNANPDFVDYPIPGNDDAVRSIKLLVSAMADSIIEAKALKEKQGNNVKKDAVQPNAQPEKKAEEKKPEVKKEAAKESKVEKKPEAKKVNAKQAKTAKKSK